MAFICYHQSGSFRPRCLCSFYRLSGPCYPFAGRAANTSVPRRWGTCKNKSTKKKELSLIYYYLYGCCQFKLHLQPNLLHTCIIFVFCLMNTFHLGTKNHLTSVTGKHVSTLFGTRQPCVFPLRLPYLAEIPQRPSTVFGIYPRLCVCNCRH